MLKCLDLYGHTVLGCVKVSEEGKRFVEPVRDETNDVSLHWICKCGYSLGRMEGEEKSPLEVGLEEFLSKLGVGAKSYEGGGESDTSQSSQVDSQSIFGDDTISWAHPSAGDQEAKVGALVKDDLLGEGFLRGQCSGDKELMIEFQRGQEVIPRPQEKVTLVNKEHEASSGRNDNDNHNDDDNDNDNIDSGGGGGCGGSVQKTDDEDDEYNQFWLNYFQNYFTLNNEPEQWWEDQELLKHILATNDFVVYGREFLDDDCTDEDLRTYVKELFNDMGEFGMPHDMAYWAENYVTMNIQKYSTENKNKTLRE